MEAQICVENGNVVFPLLNEHSGFSDTGGGRGQKLKTLSDNSVSLGLIWRRVVLCPTSWSLAAALYPVQLPLCHPLEPLGWLQPLDSAQFFSNSITIWWRSRQSFLQDSMSLIGAPRGRGFSHIPVLPIH